MEEEFVEVAPGVHVELDAKGDVIGIEILKASMFFQPIANPLYRAGGSRRLADLMTMWRASLLC